MESISPNSAPQAGVLSEEESVGRAAVQFRRNGAIVQESARWGTQSRSACSRPEGVKLAVKAGVTSIEHGSLVDEKASR